jgi:hypothetical protein
MKFSPEIVFECNNEKWQRLANMEQAFQQAEEELAQVEQMRRLQSEQDSNDHSDGPAEHRAPL